MEKYKEAFNVDQTYFTAGYVATHGLALQATHGTAFSAAGSGSSNACKASGNS
jgi:hypothetical protein